MAFLYRGMRMAMRGAVELYFVDIQSMGRELIPARGPVIFAANHPNSIMDTVLLGTLTDRIISYLARSGLFSNPLVSALFHAVGVIPLYRAQDDPTQTHRNQDSFRSAYQKLGEGGCIGIFPEGQNSQERAVQPLRTGAARIALGAEAAHDYGLDLQIIPVGLNFVNRDKFLSSVLVRFGEPIHVADFAEQHREQPREAVRALTDVLQRRLREEATHIEGNQTQNLTRDIYQIYGRKLLEDLTQDWTLAKDLTGKLLDEVRSTKAARQDLDDVFLVKQRIADAITWVAHEEPEQFDFIREKINIYKDHLDQVRLRHDFLDRRPETLSRRREGLKFTLYALTLFPFALWGLIFNALPYLITRAFALQAPDEPIRAIRALGMGMVLIPAFYGLWLWGFSTLGAGPWLLLLLGLSWVPTGFFTLRYQRQWLRYRDLILIRTLFVTDRFLILRLAAERQKLLALLDAARQRYILGTGQETPAETS